MAKNSGRLSAQRLNAISDEIVRRALEMSDMIVKELLASGYPPGFQPAPDWVQYRRLVAMAQSGDPAFWNSQQAQARLNQLQYRYGRPDEMQTALGAGVPLNAGGLERATNFAQPAGPVM